MPEKKGKNRPVFIDFETLNQQDEQTLGRPLTEQENSVISQADAIRIDALACGKTVAVTMSNIEKFGREVSDAVKSALGLVPPIN